MNKVKELMLKDTDYSHLFEKLENYKEKIEKISEKIKGPANLFIRFEGWSAERHIKIFSDKILIQITPHRDGCETCQKRLREIYSITDQSICSIVSMGSSRWDCWVEIPINEDSDPEELISKAFRGKKIRIFDY